MKVVAALSGGVDSSVAAALLVEQGHEVIGITLKLLPRGETGFGCCGSPEDVEDAGRVCAALGIPHYVLDRSGLFEEAVVRPFVDAYLAARTPNPCTACNRRVKFGRLLEEAAAFGAEAVATGHYARVSEGRLWRAEDREKDQTYFLYGLTPAQLKRVRFPLGDMSKAQVRRKARSLGLRVADKAESQEICFVPRGDYRAFLEERAPGAEALKPGAIEDSNGRMLGRHDGLAGFTIGQRRGLGIASREPLYVTHKGRETNILTVGPVEETFKIDTIVDDINWCTEERPAPRHAGVQIRHRHQPAPAQLIPLPHGGLRVLFESPQRGVAPGQAAVFNRGSEILGGGTIQ